MCSVFIFCSVYHIFFAYLNYQTLTRVTRILATVPPPRNLETGWSTYRGPEHCGLNNQSGRNRARRRVSHALNSIVLQL